MARSWNRVVWVVVCAVAALVVVEVLAARGAEQVPVGSLRLSEILAGPARDWDGDGVFDSRADEWLEVENAGSTSLDLGAYRISDADSTIRMALSGTLAAGGHLVIAGSAAVAWQRAAGRTVTGLSLNNAGDTARLFRIVGADTLEEDAHAYGSIEGAADRSTGRWAATPETWALFDGLNRYTGSGQPAGTGCPPTPGGPNACTTDIGVTTWGALKRLYR